MTSQYEKDATYTDTRVSVGNIVLDDRTEVSVALRSFSTCHTEIAITIANYDRGQIDALELDAEGARELAADLLRAADAQEVQR